MASTNDRPRGSAKYQGGNGPLAKPRWAARPRDGESGRKYWYMLLSLRAPASANPSAAHVRPYTPLYSLEHSLPCPGQYGISADTTWRWERVVSEGLTPQWPPRVLVTS